MRRIIPAILVCLFTVFWSCASIGTPPNELYFAGQSCYQDLKDNPERQKYRSYWLDCIRKFEAVHRQEPEGPWAAAGLYMAGSMYQELYKNSYKPADLTKARTLLRRVVEDYPSSAYRKDARKALKQLDSDQMADTSGAREQYYAAESCYQDLKNNSKRQKYRSAWMECIREFRQVHTRDPNGPWAAAGLFMTAELYQGLYKHSGNPQDREKARSLFERIIEKHASSTYCDRARERLGTQKAGEDKIQEVTREETASGEVTTDSAADTPDPEPGEPVTVTGIRYWSNPEYTRVVIDANQETDFKNNLLNKDPSIDQLHQRLYVDLKNSRLGNDIKKQIPIDDTLLKDVRAGQYDADTVRVVVDIKSFEDYNVFFLKNPFRIVIDVRGEAVADKQGSGGQTGTTDKDEASIAKALALGVRRVVIDPGHGGKDYGAPGYSRGVHEKHVVLDIAKKLAEQMRQELNCEVLLTRSRDAYLTLEERTAMANTKKADLFISLHANASRNKNAYGIETYFLNLTTDEESIAVAARENATSEKNISELQNILNDLMRNAKVNESSRLATLVQEGMFGQLDNRYERIKDKGVNQAPFYVLLGAQMPAILIETSFISNKRECDRLTDPAYQQELCEGIVQGVKRYIRQTRPTAYLGSGKDD